MASAKKLRGNRVAFEFPSVTATENLMMAAVLAQGETLEDTLQELIIVKDLKFLLFFIKQIRRLRQKNIPMIMLGIKLQRWLIKAIM
jgi:UDP-N-acetylglucosamine enolpyruvyl transferase